MSDTQHLACVKGAFTIVIPRSPSAEGRRRISEILRYAQNDMKALLNDLCVNRLDGMERIIISYTVQPRCVAEGGVELAEGQFVCSLCGRKTESCANELPCEALSGWFTVAQWKGLGAVERHHFCSLTCLKRWAEAHAPDIPRVFLDSFKEKVGE